MEIIYQDADVIVYLEESKALNKTFIHTKVNTWSLSAYKKYILVFGKLLNQLKTRGITELFAIPPSHKEEKWQSLFGFKDSNIKIRTFKLMRLSLWE